MVAMKQRTPAFAQADILRLAAERYGLRGAIAQPLRGEQDQNTLLTIPAGERYVLKIAHAAEDPAILDLQHRALAHLADRAPSVALPRSVPAADGAATTTTTSPDGATHLVRLLTYVPGRLLGATRPHSPELLRALGTALGTVDRALLDFTHPAADRDLRWDLPRVAWVRDHLAALPSATRRATIEGLLARFEAEAEPLLPRLRQSVIYNDAHQDNVIVRTGADSEPAIGLIDWGDTLRTTTVCELAIACAYAMMDEPDPLAVAAHLVAGYHAALPLTEDELAALDALIGARLAISAVNAAMVRQQEPENAYLTVSEAPAWALLARLAEVPPRFAHYTFRAACGLEPCPTSPRAVRWLARHQDKIGPVVAPDLKTAPSVVFDLSIGSRDLGNMPAFADEQDVSVFTRTLFEQMRAAGASVGVGRYDEARPIYTSDAYRVEGRDGPEWRTVHTALDLFM
ncbi:MAG TPA: phosphotransferase, partial [Ktedonobacterales bacterium]